MTTATKATKTTAPKRNKGGFSIIKLGLIAGGIGIAMVVIGFLAFSNDQASRRTPFNIEPFPGAQDWGTADQTSFSQIQFYRVPNVAPEEVATYYQNKLNQHTGNSGESCIRFPQTGTMPVAPNNPRAIPYEYRCLFDNSGFQTTQNTLVRIYPGFGDSTGMTVIEYQQRWTP